MTAQCGDRPSPPRPRHARRTRYPDLSPAVPTAPPGPAPAASWPAWTDLPLEAFDLVAVDPDTELPLFGRAGRGR